MGIRFACHVCERRLNIKRELAGRRGICPVCAAKIRIPLADTEKSTPVAEKPVAKAVAPAREDALVPSESLASADPGTVPHEPAANLGANASPAPATVTSAATSEPEDQLESGLAGSIDLSDDTAAATWYVRPPSGGQYGPATTEVLKQWINEGRVAASALLWREGWPQWRDASEALPEFAARLPDSRSGGGGSAYSPKPAESVESFPSSVPLESSTRTSAPRETAPADVDSVRRSRAIRRVTTIAVLAVVALTLILILVVVLGRG